MMKPHHFILLMTLVADGGTVAPQPSTSVADGGTVAPQPSTAVADGGIVTRQPIIAGGIHWPDEVRPLARLDGPAVLAAHAAMQRLLSSFPKEYAGTCSHSAKAMEVLVGEEGGLYFVQINQRVEKCGGFAPGFNLTFDWFELYAVSPDGKVLARYPYYP
jgi:hypothetical protein